MGNREQKQSDYLIDPRLGDIEDDAASPRDRSLLVMAGAMLVEINFLKLALAAILLIVVPAIPPRRRAGSSRQAGMRRFRAVSPI